MSPGVSVSNVISWLLVESAIAVLPAYAFGAPIAAPSNSAAPAPAARRTGPVKERFIEPPDMGRPGRRMHRGQATGTGPASSCARRVAALAPKHKPAHDRPGNSSDVDARS